MDLEMVIKNLGLFVIILVVFLLILSIVLKRIVKNFKLNNNKVKIYGVLFSLENKSLIAISCITINYIFLTYLLVSFNDINIFYIIFSCLLILIGDIVTHYYKRIPLDMVLSIVNLLAVKVVYLLYDYITNEYMSIIVLISLILLIIFVFLYFTYSVFKQINNVVVKEKYLNQKDYKL